MLPKNGGDFQPVMEHRRLRIGEEIADKVVPLIGLLLGVIRQERPLWCRFVLRVLIDPDQLADR
ncbi:hypothetical protein, partial [Schleiferilactobacillus harbinensis]|uniref:hypothetical protein n=1 Tax=Schleiferilactobacillus harbinensis TaxID=304207 RepID=UPI0039ED4B81